MLFAGQIVNANTSWRTACLTQQRLDLTFQSLFPACIRQRPRLLAFARTFDRAKRARPNSCANATTFHDSGCGKPARRHAPGSSDPRELSASTFRVGTASCDGRGQNAGIQTVHQNADMGAKWLTLPLQPLPDVGRQQQRLVSSHGRNVSRIDVPFVGRLACSSPIVA